LTLAEVAHSYPLTAMVITGANLADEVSDALGTLVWRD